jgi:hypothetical protein
MDISSESAWEKLNRWSTNSFLILVRLAVPEGAAIWSGKVSLVEVSGGFVILRRDSERFKVVLTSASFEESETTWALDSLTIRFPRGGYCSLYQLRSNDDDWPELIDL